MLSKFIEKIFQHVYSVYTPIIYARNKKKES